MPTAPLLNEVRRRRGMPMAELARRAGVSRNTLYYVERGTGVSLDTLVKIAAALEVPLVEISPSAADLVKGVA